MITICHPVDDLELLLFRMALQAEGIPHLVVGDHFGSLYPGMQIPSFNERSVRVPADYIKDALKVLDKLRATYRPTSDNLTTRSKIRMLLEGLFLGWVMPGGRKKDL